MVMQSHTVNHGVTNKVQSLTIRHDVGGCLEGVFACDRVVAGNRHAGGFGNGSEKGVEFGTVDGGENTRFRTHLAREQGYGAYVAQGDFLAAFL